MATTKVKSTELAPVVSAADANGWIKRDMGTFFIWEKTISTSGTTVAGNSNTSLGSTNLPVGITDTSGVRLYCTCLGGFAGRIYASFDNGNTLSAVASPSVQLGNLTAGSINYIGYVHLMAISV